MKADRILSNPLAQLFYDALKEKRLVTAGDHILSALSGGADSVAMTVLFAAWRENLSLKLTAFHLNHQLRGAEADRDERFCRDLCAEWEIPFISRSENVQEYARLHKLSFEMAARELRYRFFEEVASEHGCNKIATAHHSDDQVETLLLRLFKGCGVQGLTGIPARRGNIIRPLLGFTREQILSFLNQNDIPYQNDSTNNNSDYERNYLRNEVIPAIVRKFPAFKKKLTDLSEIVDLEETFWSEALDELSDYAQFDGERLIIDKTLFESNRALANRFIRRSVHQHFSADVPLNRTHSDLIYDSAQDSQGNRIILELNGIRFRSSYHNIVIEKAVKNFQNPPKYVKIEDNFVVNYGLYRLRFRVETPDIDRAVHAETETCYFDPKSGSGLEIRNRQDGDRIDIGRGHTRKLKDWFIDRKFTQHQRAEAVLLYLEGEIAAIYVPGFGFRVFEPYYVHSGSETMLKVTIEKDVL